MVSKIYECILFYASICSPTVRIIASNANVYQCDRSYFFVHLIYRLFIIRQVVPKIYECIIFYASVCNPTVRIIAFQAIDPGSTPGKCKCIHRNRVPITCTEDLVSPRHGAAETCRAGSTLNLP